MSLILGINLPRYLYLVSDTRLTRRQSEEIEYQDNFLKYYCFNENVSAVVVGNAKFANYVLRKFGESELVNKGFIFIESNIKQFIIEAIRSYLDAGNEYRSAVFIFAGFDKSGKKQINTSQYGKTLANTFVPGKKQIINKDIIQKIAETAVKNGRNSQKGIVGTLEKNTIIEMDLPYSSMVTVEVNLPDKPIINKVGCYKCIMKAPRGLTEDSLPKELAYKLEQQQAKSYTGEEIWQAQSVALMAWVSKMIEEHKLNTVGGDIVVNMITPEGGIIMVGILNKLDIKTKEIKKVSEIIVHNGEFCVRGKIGEIIPLENIYDFNGNGEGEFEL